MNQQENHMSTVLITGGGGLIGAKVSERLVREGHNVVVMDPFIQYLLPLRNKIKDYLDRRFDGFADKVTFERGDTTNISATRNLIARYRPEYVLHLAAVPIANLSNVHVEEAVQSILIGAVNMLEILKDVDHLKRFLYVSSSMTYGDFQTIPCPEDHPKNPKGIYGGAKYAGEVMTRTFGNRFDIPYTIVRPSAVYGPYDINRRVSQIFVENALEGKSLRLDGGGKLAFDFTFVEDIAQGLILALTSESSLGEDFNITYGRGYTLLEFAETLRQFVPDVKMEVVEERDLYRPLRGALDISKARSVLGYAPQYPLERGLEIYVETYRKLPAFRRATEAASYRRAA
jgi:UDP-glucose 4-epimerase